MKTMAWRPALTTQFPICPVPFRLDTYRGCVYNCNYCLARDFIEFSRRHSEHKESTYLIGNDPLSFGRWMNRVDQSSAYNYAKGEEVAVKERIPLKIGTVADPFPPVERQAKITYKFLQMLDYYDYPVEILTKNPEVLLSYSREFKNPNWVIGVTLISTDEEFIKACEPYAISARARLEAIKGLVSEGKKVMTDLKPAIYSKVIADLPELVRQVALSGAWAMNIAGLKIRTTMPKSEQALFEIIGRYLGMNIRDYFKAHGERTGSDWELLNEYKLQYIDLAEKLCREYHLQYLVGENFMGKRGDSCECCGTGILRNHKVWGNNDRVRAFGGVPNASQELGKCLVNFTRNGKNANRTMDEIASEFLSKQRSQP